MAPENPKRTHAAEVGRTASVFDADSADDAAIAWWIRALSRLPLGVLYFLTGVLAFVLRHLLHYRLSVARDNLSRCFPERSARDIDRLLGSYYRQLGQVIAEFLKGATMSAEELRARLRLVNAQRVQREFQAGRSVLLVGAHQCNWEWSLLAVSLQLGVPIDAGYKPLHAPAADRQLRKFRTRFGARLLVAKKLLREVIRRRREVRAVALIPDQVPSSSDSRHWLSFLGRDTAFFPGPAEIARITGYAAFFVAMRRTGRGRYELDFQPISDAGERLEPQLFTLRYARLLEALIREHPADWTWTHRRWKLSRPCGLAAPEPAAH